MKLFPDHTACAEKRELEHDFVVGQSDASLVSLFVLIEDFLIGTETKGSRVEARGEKSATHYLFYRAVAKDG